MMLDVGRHSRWQPGCSGAIKRLLRQSLARAAACSGADGRGDEVGALCSDAETG